ncbi:MAG: haloacid dehalogenase-like hydrolase [Longimicrobiales bacterium]|nr:haloacid dehalogenase-like hydrolase [Longimicrobiales bacterium]
MTRFASVILDADSTLASIEGIDWLAARRGPDVAREVAGLTGAAMAGLVPLESVYARRLELIAPTALELEELGRTYVSHADPGAAGALARLREMGVALHVVSGGLRPALLPLTRRLGFGDGDVHAVDVDPDSTGAFVAVVPSPLCTQAGKAGVARSLALPRPCLAVGDGATDLAMRPEVDAFAAYVGFVRREPVVAGADFVVASFPELLELVLRRA